jgi:hypothetical protein
VFCQITGTVIRFQHCVDVGAERVVYSVPSISCRDGRYESWLGVVIALMLIVTVGAPLGLLAVLLWRRKQLDAPEFRRRWGVLTEPFNSSAFFYQVR